MKRLLLLSVLLLLCLPTWAEDASSDTDGVLTVKEMQTELNQYDQSSLAQKVSISNRLFEAYAEVADTLYRFDNSVDEEYLDFFTWYWSSEYAYENEAYKESFDMAREALQKITDSVPIDVQSDCYNIAAIASHRMGDYGTSADMAYQCLELSRQTGDLVRVSTALNTIAAIHLAAGEPQQGIQYIDEAISIEREQNNYPSLAVRLGMASNLYLKMEQYDKAYTMAEEALGTERKGGNMAKVAIRQSQLAAVCIEQKDYAKAQPLLEESVKSLRQQNNRHSLSIVLGQLANVYMNIGRNSDAEPLIEESIELSQQTGNIYIEAKQHRLLAKLLRDRQSTRAYDELSTYAQLQDSIYQEQLATKLQEFNARYDTAQKEHQLELQQEQIRKQQFTTIALVVAIVVALFFIVILGRLASLRKRNNIMLVQTNLAKDELLSLSNQENETLRNKRLLDLAQRMEQLGSMPEVKLTQREREIITLFARGQLAKEVAAVLGISVRTVENYKSRIYHKLGISNTVELMHYAKQTGLIDEK